VSDVEDNVERVEGEREGDGLDTDPDAGLEALLVFLRDHRGFDFAGYKRPSLGRRVRRRMDEVGIADHTAYLACLEAEPSEFEELFDRILINVTSFFRDAPVWEGIRQVVIPAILRSKGDDDELRVWCAGCASGEEPYSVAMLLADALGEDEALRRVRIFATDVDDRALAQARLGCYPAREVAALSRGYGERYFEPGERTRCFRRDLRRTVVFGRHDLLQDPPISRIDLLLCRNTLIYLNAEAQQEVRDHLRYALLPGGHLVLGTSESLVGTTDDLEPVDGRLRIFRRPSELPRGEPGGGPPAAPAPSALAPNAAESALEAAPLAHVVVDPRGRLVLANRHARVLFGLSRRDLGRPLQDLELSYRPVDLRTPLDDVAARRRPVQLHEVAWTGGSEAGDRFLDIHLQPLVAADGRSTGTSIAFVDTSRARQLEDELHFVRRELESAYEELQSTVEELETTNEELQSTNEELETTNEELQSLNEELQSTNDELAASNDRLRRSSDELDATNAFLAAVLAGLRDAVAVVDGDLVVQVWNARAEDQWGVRADEVRGRAFLALDIGLPVGRLREPLQAAIDAGEESALVLPAIDRRGRSIVCRVLCSPLRPRDRRASGAMVVIEELPEAGAGPRSPRLEGRGRPGWRPPQPG
jgi:two-component system CheB/CheR fusion protein